MVNGGITLKVLDQKCKTTILGADRYGFDAEMQIENDNGDIVFLHAKYFDDEYFTVTNRSIFDYMTQEATVKPDIAYLEEYTSLDISKQSKYYKYFCMLDRYYVR